MLPEFTARGASLVTLSPQLPEYSRAWVEEDGIEFPVLPDLGNGIARTFGLVFALPEELRNVYRTAFKIDLTRFNGDASWELAIPASYVIDSDGIVRYASVDPDYTRRPEPSEILAALP